jgi:hypothetical protein
MAGPNFMDMVGAGAGAVGNAFGNIGHFLGSTFAQNGAPMGDGTFAAPNTPAMGSADTGGMAGGGGAQEMVQAPTSPAPLGNAMLSGAYGQPSGAGSAPADPSANSGGPSSNAINYDAVIRNVLQGNGGQFQNYMNQLNGMNLDKIDYQKAVSDLYNSPTGILAAHDQAKTTGDQAYGTAMGNVANLYNSHIAAAARDANIAKNQGAATGAALKQDTSNQVANLANTQMQDRQQLAQTAQRLGMSSGTVQAMLQGKTDNVRQGTDPLSMAIQAASQNGTARQDMNNTQTAANLQDNKVLQGALGAQSSAAQAGLGNQQATFNVNSDQERAKLLQAEDQAMYQAVQQNRSDQLARINAGVGITKDASDAQNNLLQTLIGTRGYGYNQDTLGSANYQNAKAAQLLGSQGNSPMDAAVQAANAKGQNGTDLANLYNTALAKMPGVVTGTKPTNEDIFREMTTLNPNMDMSAIQGFLQNADASRAVQTGVDPNIAAMLMSNQVG